MAAAHIFPPFDQGKETWDAYVARFECFLIANEYTNLSAERKRAYFLSFCGPEIFDTAMTLMAPQSIHAGTWEEFMGKLKRHYAPAPSRIARRQQFYHRDQAPGESINQYVAALRRAARHCQFDNLDDYLLDRLVSGVRDQNLKQRLIANQDLTFQEALREACAAELAALSIAELPRGQSTATSAAEGNSTNEISTEAYSESEEEGEVCRIRETKPKAAARNKTGRALECFSCGGEHIRASCRFKDAVCRNCGRRGHIARVCRSAQLQKSSRYPPDADTQRRAGPRPAHARQQRGFSAVNLVASRSHTGSPKIILTVQIEGRPCDMEVDTGSSTTIVSWSTIKRLVPKLAKRQLEPCNLLLKDYQGALIPVVGTGTFRVNFRNFHGRLSLVIVDGPLPSLLGLNWFAALGLTIQGIHSIRSSELDTLVREFPSVFSDSLGKYKGTPVSFSLDPAVPPKRLKPRRVPLALRPRVDEELDKLIHQGVLEPVDYARWETPTVIAIKANGSIRICADYRATINLALQDHAYPVPVVQHLLHSLGQGSVFAKLDLSQAYQQLPVDDLTAEAQTIITHRGAFRCRRLQFGVSVAPGIFQSLMERLLYGIPGVAPYFDDVIVSASSIPQLMSRLRRVLSVFQHAGLTVKKDKCLVAVPQVEFLGFLIDGQGIHPTPSKTKAILDAPPPTSKAELQAFLGLLNFYAVFLPHKASVAEPLHRLLDRGARWSWDARASAAFSAVKRLLVSNSVLVQYSDTLPLVLACDASPYGVGAVLSHLFPDGGEAPIAFYSRTLAPAERNYSQLDKEALAIIAGVKKFHDYLYGRRFSIVTDHKPLLGLIAGDRPSPQFLSPRLTRWSVFLSAYSYTLSYVPGKHLAHADALSRCPLKMLLCDPAPVSAVLLIDDSPLPVMASDIALASARDKELSMVLQWVLRGWPSGELGLEWKPYALRKSELSVQEGCLLWGHRVIVPTSLRNSVLAMLHEGHPGIVRMKALARAYLWWPKLDECISTWVSTCSKCQESRPMPPKGVPRQWEDPSGPWSRVHVDFAGPIHGQMFLVLVDAFSKWIEVIPMRSTTTEALIRSLQALFATHGLPDELVSDNGPQLTSSGFEMFLAGLGIRHCLISPYHPASNGRAERAVRSTKDALGHMGFKNWPSRLAEYLLIQHSTPCPLTNRSPAELLMGRRLRTVLDRLHPSYAPRNPLRSNQACSKLTEGDLVYARNYTGQPLWVPGVIVGVTGPCSYKIDVGEGRIWRRHLDQIRVRRVNGRRPGGPDEGDTDTDPDETTKAETNPQHKHDRPPSPQPRSQGQAEKYQWRGDTRESTPCSARTAKCTPCQSRGENDGLLALEGEGPVVEEPVAKDRGQQDEPKIPRRSGRVRHRPPYLQDYVCSNQG